MADKWFQGYQIVQSIVMMLAAVLAWFWGRQQKAERELLDDRFRTISERLAAYELDHRLRIDRINEQLSGKFMPAIQALISQLDRLPDELRNKFLPLDRATDLLEESRRDRQALWKELEQVERRRPSR